MSRVSVLVLAGLLLPALGAAEDRMLMDETAIKGSRELPKVLYIVPWKSARLGALAGGAGSDAFTPQWEALEHEVFRRQVVYYDMLYPSGTPGSP